MVGAVCKTASGVIVKKIKERVAILLIPWTKGVTYVGFCGYSNSDNGYRRYKEMG